MLEIDEEHLARLQPSLDLDVCWINVEYAHFAGHDDAIVVRNVVTARSQTVPVQCRSDHITVGKGDRGGAVPWFLKRRVILVKGSFVLGHGVVILPGLGDHHHDRFGQAASGHHQGFQRIVKIS